MNIEELRRQRIIARAELDSLKQMHRRGEATADDVTAQELILADILNFRKAVPVAKKEEPKKPEQKLFQPPPDSDETLNILKRELAEIDAKKNRIANQLADIPENQKALELVKDIKHLRTVWAEKSDEIYYYQRHGELPVKSTPEPIANGEFAKQLPPDKYELERMRNNLRTNLSKYRGRLNKAKTEASKANQRRNIQKAEIEINYIEDLMAVL